MTTVKTPESVTISREQYDTMQNSLMQLRTTVKAYEELAGGDGSYMQSKIHSQRVALRRLNRRVLNQRFILRTLENLGRGLSKEERIAAFEADPKSHLLDLDDVIG